MGSAAVYGLMRGDMGVAYNKVCPGASWLHAVTAPSTGPLAGFALLTWPAVHAGSASIKLSIQRIFTVVTW
jgi:hypothetical protein